MTTSAGQAVFCEVADLLRLSTVESISVSLYVIISKKIITFQSLRLTVTVSNSQAEVIP